ncbi:TraB/GumN family protein [Erythrobacter insulae]|uniref:TraB/GumN family protein n=1 Tax=Erythrobacter insulae TaxID=2584124 RepID=A0A547P6Z9_9SPHN|nr:TraB/GumN family protein [Erythrobacter insulae]TRD09898.1 TraB/GumN family protein [Erythrobacter insulae]
MTPRLIKQFGTLLGALAIAGCSEAPFKGEPQPAPNPLLYEITNSNGDVEGWMLGTIHALPDDVEWRTKEIDNIISQADLAVVEVANLDDSDAVAATFARLAASPGHPELTQRVDDELRLPLYELIAISDYSDHDFSSTETWAAALMLARTQATGNPQNGVDRAIIRDFSARNITELEGAFDQLRIFDTLKEADQRVLLEGVVIEAKDPASSPEKLRKAWLSGDENVLASATKSGIMADPELYQALIVRRNQDWAERLEGILARTPKPLIAVGAGHLVGTDSLTSMLETRGYSVRRIAQNSLP